MIRQPVDYTLPAPNVLRDLIKRTEQLLNELHESMTEKMFGAAFGAERAGPETKPLSAGKSLREPIFYGGESAYSFQYRDLAVRKYMQDDVWLEANKEFSISIAATIVKAILTLQNDKQAAGWSALKSVSQRDRTLLPGFTFTTDEVAKLSGVDSKAVGRALAAFSLPAEDRNTSFNALHDFNTINATPLLQVGPQEFILFQYYSLVEALYESPFYWMAADKSYAPTALDHRGRFTEAFAHRCLHKVFGTSHVYANVIIEGKKSARRGEIDVLVLFGDRAIILQAKSKRLTIESRKGNDLQIKDDFKKAVQDAYDQALDCSIALSEQGCRLLDQEGNSITLFTPLRKIYPICIVADHYPALAFQAREFLKYEKTDTVAAPLVTDVFAIDAIAEMLDSPLSLLSYLDLRARFGERLMVTHELTLLSYHLKYNLWFNSEYDLIMLEEDIGVDLDVAMAVRREGIAGQEFPKGILTRLRNTPVGRLLSELDRQSESVAIDLGLFLLSIREETIDALNEAIRNFIAYAGKASKRHDVTIAVSDASSGITIHSNSFPDAEAKQHLLAHCELRKYSQRANSWFGIAIRPNNGSIRFCVKIEHPWESDEKLEGLVQTLRQARPITEVKAELRATRKVGRNAPCPCGSGRKYKKCCLR
jgi:hypothetical protein